jgi:hypothetical protein
VLIPRGHRHGRPANEPPVTAGSGTRGSAGPPRPCAGHRAHRHDHPENESALGPGAARSVRILQGSWGDLLACSAQFNGRSASAAKGVCHPSFTQGMKTAGGTHGTRSRTDLTTRVASAGASADRPVTPPSRTTRTHVCKKRHGWWAPP